MQLDQAKCFCIDMATRIVGGTDPTGAEVIKVAQKIADFVKTDEKTDETPF